MSDLVVVPTELERRGLGEFPRGVQVFVVGFGPIAAAASTAHLVATLQPSRILLVGIAGSFDLEVAPLDSAHWFGGVECDGVGAIGPGGFRGPRELGFPQLPSTGGRAAVFDMLTLARPRFARADTLAPLHVLTAPTPSFDATSTAERRLRHPRVVAEDMEAFGVALAAHRSGTPCAVVRGISNAVGARDVAGWHIGAALAAAAELARAVLEVDWSLPEDGPP